MFFHLENPKEKKKTKKEREGVLGFFEKMWFSRKGSRTSFFKNPKIVLFQSTQHLSSSAA